MFARSSVGLVVVALLAGGTSALGMTFTSQQANVLPGTNLDARSASLADYDNDGDLDLMFQGGTGAQRLYRNNLIGSGNFTYTNVTSLLPTSTLGPSWSAAWGDYDGDGRVDVFVGQSNLTGTGDVLRNTATGFVNTSVATGLDDPGFHQNVAWVDIDSDHDLDLVICMEGPDEKHEVYLQGPAQQFTPVGATAGVQVEVGVKGYGMAIGDTDNDGDLDIYISTCRGDNNIRNNFFENRLVETGSLAFVDIADDNGTQNYRNSYGAEFHDFDDDGDLDLFMVGADRQPSKIFRNDGDNEFTDIDSLTGRPLLTDVSADLGGARAVDYDNDGDLDLYFHDHLAGSTNQARKLYRNDGDWLFTDVTVAEGIHEINQGGYDSAWGDLDLDGDMDLVAPTNTSWNERVFISNATTNGNHWLQVDLLGPSYNTTGIGASLYATIHDGTEDERQLRREANTNAGTFNQSDLPVHFGLGTATLIDELLIRWSDGTIQVLHDIAVDQYTTISYADALLGDFNGDGLVDAADYTVWCDGLGHIFRQSDYDVWQANFGAVAAAASTATGVPEPSTVLMASVTVGLLLRRRLWLHA